MNPVIQLQKRFVSFGFIYSAGLSGSPSLRSRMFDRHRYTAGFLPP